MAQEDFQKKYETLLEKVTNMRKYQSRYFQYRATSDKNAAKAMQREVDQLIKREAAKRNTKQPDLFSK